MPTYERALVTGASSGIGEAFARALAARGTALVVVARREDRLQALAAELPVDVEVLAADLSADTSAVEARLQEETRPVDLLVNNAGFGTTGPFAELPLEREDEEIRLNVLALMRLTHAVLPGLVRRDRGAIVNVASVAGFSAAPRNATYTGTKAFVLTFTEGLAEEVRGTGVRVQALCPGLTRTEFQGTADYDASSAPAAAWQSADAVVAESLAALDRGRVVVVPGLHNRALVGTASLLPRAARRRIAGLVTRQ